MMCLNTFYRPICWVMTLTGIANHWGNKMTKHQSQQRDRNKEHSNNRGTRWLCRQSALFNMEVGNKKLWGRVVSQMVSETCTQISFRQKRMLLSHATTEAVVVSPAAASTDTKPSPNIYYSDWKPILLHQYYSRHQYVLVLNDVTFFPQFSAVEHHCISHCVLKRAVFHTKYVTLWGSAFIFKYIIPWVLLLCDCV